MSFAEGDSGRWAGEGGVTPGFVRPVGCDDVERAFPVVCRARGEVDLRRSYSEGRIKT